MTILHFMKYIGRPWQLARMVVTLKAEAQTYRRQIGGLRSHNTRMKREHDEKLIGLIASKEVV